MPLPKDYPVFGHEDRCRGKTTRFPPDPCTLPVAFIVIPAFTSSGNRSTDPLWEGIDFHEGHAIPTCVMHILEAIVSANECQDGSFTPHGAIVREAN